MRIAVHLGDVVDAPDGGVYGDAVNVAARLQERAPPGGVVISRAVHEQVRHRLAYAADDLGPLALKNIGRRVHAFRVRPAAAPQPQRRVAPAAAASGASAEPGTPAPASPPPAAGGAWAAAALLGSAVILSAAEGLSGAGPIWAAVSGAAAPAIVVGLAIRRALGGPRRRRPRA